MPHRNRNVYLTDVIPDESPPELVQIREGIHDKLSSKGIPVTANIDKAHFIVVFFTRGSIRRLLDILFRLPKLAIGYSVVLWDKKQYARGDSTLKFLLRLSCFDDELAEELDGDVPDGDTPDFPFRVREALRYMDRHSLKNTTILRNRYIPDYVTDMNSLVDLQVETIAKLVNPLSIDFRKFDLLESDLVKITGLIHTHKDDMNGDTRFLVISGCAQTHDITTITKCLSFTYMCSFPYHHFIRYLDKCPQYYPQPPLPFTLATGLLAHCLELDIADYNNALLEMKEIYCDDIKTLIILEGISSLDEFKEIRKLGDLCNQIGRGSMVILSTGLNVFRDCESNFKSNDSVFLGYVEGAAPAGQTENMDDAADGWRPFCLKLNDSQLGDVIEMVECRARGGMPKDLNGSMTVSLDDSMSVGVKRGVGEGANEGSIEEAVGDSKRFKLTNQHYVLNEKGLVLE